MHAIYLLLLPPINIRRQRNDKELSKIFTQDEIHELSLDPMTHDLIPSHPGKSYKSGGVLLPMMIKILICGDRKWTNLEKIKNVLLDTINTLWVEKGGYIMSQDFIFDPNKIIVIEGDATGADKLGKQAALELGIPERNILEYPAPWDDIDGKPESQIGIRYDKSKYWKSAGPYRNIFMLKESEPDIVLAFHNNLEDSKGTKHMVKISKAAGIRTLVFDSN